MHSEVSYILEVMIRGIITEQRAINMLQTIFGYSQAEAYELVNNELMELEQHEA